MSMPGEYSNRSDLRNPATRRVAFTGQTYGESAAQQRAQDVAAQRMANRVRPGARPLGRPTDRPNEPITAGANFGAGPDAMQAGIRPRMIESNDVEEQLDALYRAYPNEGLLLLLERIRNRRG